MPDEAVEGMLSAGEARVLGSLMEKQMTTPDYYPLTLKALTAACNQKSSRAPVMQLSGSEVAGIVNALRGRGLVTARMDGRVDRYEQHLSRRLKLTGRERAVLCVLMLRGPQTLNEIRIHTGRMVEFSDSREVEETLRGMMETDEALLVRLPRAAGQREERYAQLLCGKPDVPAPSLNAGSVEQRLAELERQVAGLRSEVARLKEER